MKQGMSVDLFTTENTSKSFIKQMESMSLDISDYFCLGLPQDISLHVVGFEWKKEEMVNILAHLITHIQSSKSQVIIVDSLTFLPNMPDRLHPHLLYQLQIAGRSW